MIIVRLKGGLGNQMFQYAFAKSLAFQKKVNFELDARFLLDRTHIKNFVYRNYDLDIFTVDDCIYNGRKLIPYEVYIDKLKNLVLLKIQKMIKSSSNNNYYLEEHDNFNEKYLEISSDSYCVGYFQSYKFFEPIKELIKKDFSFKSEINEDCKQLLHEIRSKESLCINFRRSDFVANPFYDVIPQDYYEKALNQIRELVPNLHIYVFSDDVEWCENNLIFDLPHTFVSHKYAGKKFRSYLELMIECKHFIIPNSTFAWWAAYLCNNKDKKVIVPKVWDMNGEKNDLIPTDWIRV